MSASPPAADPREALADHLAARMWRAWATLSLALLLVGVHVQVGVFRASRGAVDGATALLGARGGRLLTRVGGMKSSRVDEGELWRLVSAVFLHTNLLHLTLNVVGLLLVGRLVEAMLGATRMFTVFLWSGVAGAASSWLISATPVSVGASGGIFGLMGAALVFVLRHGEELPDDVRRHLRKHLIISILFNLPVGLIVPVVDQAAHVGGLVGGAVLGALLGDRVTAASRARSSATAALALGCAAALAWAAWGLRRTI